MLPAITKRRRVRRASGGRRGGHVGVRRLVVAPWATAAYAEPCPRPSEDVAKLLKCYGREFGWRLGRPELAKWAEAFDSDGDGLVSAADVRDVRAKKGWSVEGRPRRTERSLAGGV